MGKVLVWIAIGLAAWLAWRLLAGARRRSTPPDRPETDGAAGGAEAEGRGADAPSTPELMMQCAVCGIHLPGSEARFARGRVFCSDAHRDQHTAATREGAGRDGDA
jgi:uncharacterized protein